VIMEISGAGAVARSGVRRVRSSAGTDDRGIEITGEAGQIERFRRLIGAMAAVAEPAADAPAGQSRLRRRAGARVGGHLAPL